MRKEHSDPDNSGMCIYCGYILDVLDEEDEQHNRELEAKGKVCGSKEPNTESKPW